MSIKATSDVEKSCSTSEMSSSDVELDSSKGSVLNMRRPRVVATSGQPESCSGPSLQDETERFTYRRLVGCGPG